MGTATTSWWADLPGWITTRGVRGPMRRRGVLGFLRTKSRRTLHKKKKLKQIPPQGEQLPKYTSREEGMRSAGKAGYWETTPHEGARLTGKDSKPNQDCMPKTTPKRQKKRGGRSPSEHALHVAQHRTIATLKTGHYVSTTRRGGAAAGRGCRVQNKENEGDQRAGEGLKRDSSNDEQCKGT